MGNDRECRSVQEQVAAYSGGWLSASMRARVEAHLDACERCAAVYRLDDRLREALSAIPQDIAPAASWAQARQAASAVRPSPVRRRPALALAAAGAAAFCALLLFRGEMRTPPHQPASTTQPGLAIAPQSTWVDAHDLLSAGEVTADPNRAVVLLYASRRRDQAVR